MEPEEQTAVEGPSKDPVSAEAGEPAASAVLCRLDHLGLISISGEDAAEFVQSQFSNDTREVAGDVSQLGSYCNPKGRMLAVFRMFQMDEAYLLQLPAELLEAIRRRLSMYVLRARVRVADVSEDLNSIGLFGTDVSGLLKGKLGALPDHPHGVARRQGLTVLRVDGPVPRFEIIGNAEEVATIRASLEPECVSATASAWELQNIRAGIPTIWADTAEAFVPQMTNLHLLGGVDFKKGCYPGQEIVARMHYLGKLKRRMYLAGAALESCPPAGTPVFDQPEGDRQSVGTVVDSQRVAGSGCELLVVVQIEVAEHRAVYLQQPFAAKLRLGELPYSFDES